MKTNTTHGGFLSRSTAAGLVLLLVFVGWPPTAAAKTKSNWSEGEAVMAETRTTVVLYKDRAPREKRKISGLFQSATADSITLMMSNGQTRTLQKRAVRKVLTRRPIGKRYAAWIITGAVAGVVQSGINSDLLPIGHLAIHAATTLPVAAFLLYGFRRRVIYEVPLKHRDPSSTKATPPKPLSSRTVHAVAKAAEGDTGSGSENNLLSEVVDPEIVRCQARQPLLLKGLNPPSLSGLAKTFPQAYGVSRADSVE